ncbi:hypothetical protein CROQUDRAFT_85647 [Cronartium quercuum f. sp. fusiforme G11]|uniref:Uncharacterized protein n=1 Tax=Cronartium quercuum f. sp. fusiforme G11 TaxID=708437 RepID=A0A9P6NYM1_9BASI|nr:hypothetical protein CROQUDRAFT_85647 [Cronartium quercuum f. sp. fusiforme G11]
MLMKRLMFSERLLTVSIRFRSASVSGGGDDGGFGILLLVGIFVGVSGGWVKWTSSDSGDHSFTTDSDQSTGEMVVAAFTGSNLNGKMEED